MKNKKMLIAVGSGVGVLALVATATFFAFFQGGDKTETSVTTGVVNVELIESFPDGGSSDEIDPSNPGVDDATKVITGENTGTQPAYVRVKVFPQIEEYDARNGYKLCGVPTSYATYTESKDGWIDGNDGYYYYAKILQPGETTSPITISDVNIDIPSNLVDIEPYEGAINRGMRLNMVVELESTQASNELYKLNWNLTSLPAGVEQ